MREICLAKRRRGESSHVEQNTKILEPHAPRYPVLDYYKYCTITITIVITLHTLHTVGGGTYLFT